MNSCVNNSIASTRWKALKFSTDAISRRIVNSFTSGHADVLSRTDFQIEHNKMTLCMKTLNGRKRKFENKRIEITNRWLCHVYVYLQRKFKPVFEGPFAVINTLSPPIVMKLHRNIFECVITLCTINHALFSMTTAS
jgi:hypothetical protein